MTALTIPQHSGRSVCENIMILLLSFFSSTCLAAMMYVATCRVIDPSVTRGKRLFSILHSSYDDLVTKINTKEYPNRVARILFKCAEVTEGNWNKLIPHSENYIDVSLVE